MRSEKTDQAGTVRQAAPAADDCEIRKARSGESAGKALAALLPEARRLGPEETHREVVEAWIMGNDENALCLGRRCGQKVENLPGAGQIEVASLFNARRAGQGFDPLERFPRPPGGGNQDEIGFETQRLDRAAHGGRIGLTLAVERAIMVAEARIVPARLGVAQEKELAHKAILARNAVPVASLGTDSRPLGAVFFERRIPARPGRPTRDILDHGDMLMCATTVQSCPQGEPPVDTVRCESRV